MISFLVENISKKKPTTNTTHNKTMKTKTFITAAVLATAMHASAAITIIDPISVSKEGGGVPQSGSLSQVIDNSGLSFDLNTGDLVPSTLPTHDGGLTYTNNAVRWFTFDLLGAEVPDALIFDLGQVYSTGLGDILFWNYSEQAPAGDRGISDVTASFSSDGISYSGDTTVNFTQASLIDNPFAGETVGLNQYGDIRYVKFTDINGPGDGSLIGFSEIRFTALPEPSSTALLGLGGAALMLRRRRK